MIQEERWIEYKKDLNRYQKTVANIIETSVKQKYEEGYFITRPELEQIIYENEYHNELYPMIEYLMMKYGEN